MSGNLKDLNRRRGRGHCFEASQASRAPGNLGLGHLDVDKVRGIVIAMRSDLGLGGDQRPLRAIVHRGKATQPRCTGGFAGIYDSFRGLILCV